MLQVAEDNWAELIKGKFIFSAPSNKGEWVHDWRLVLSEYGTR